MASPEQIVDAALEAGCRSVAYTYTEPTVFFEYSYEIARLARREGLMNIYVTNGYMTEDMLETFHPYLDAANVDLKAFRDDIYRKYAGARLQPVLDSLRTMKRLGIWVEVTTLIVPGINDDPADLKEMVQFVAGELGVETPWHISRFFPTYKMSEVPPTPVETLCLAREIGMSEGLQYVYTGNVRHLESENTICPECGETLIRRNAYVIVENQIGSDGFCPGCGTHVAGLGMACS